MSGAVFDTKQRIAALRIKAARVLVVDGEALCQACGSMKALNTILLGAAAASEALGLSEAELDQTIAQTMPKTYQQLNRRALKLGAAAGREAQCR